MNKQLIAKLLALGLVLTMLPVTAFAAAGTTPDKDKVPPGANYVYQNDLYYWSTDDTTPSGGTNGTSGAPAIPVNTINENGIVEVEVVNGAVSLSFTNTVIEKLAEQVKDGKMTLEIKADGAGSVRVSLPIEDLAAAAKANGADLEIKTPVGTITIPNKVLTMTFKSGRFLDISVQSTEDGLAVSIKVGNTELKDIKGVKVG